MSSLDEEFPSDSIDRFVFYFIFYFLNTYFDYDGFILLFPCLNNSEGAVQSKEAAAVSAPEQLNPDRNDPAAPENICSAGVAFENGLNGKEEETCQQAKIIIVNENNKENENINLSNEKETAADSNGTQRRFSLYFMQYLLIATLLHVFVRIFQLGVHLENIFIIIFRIVCLLLGWMSPTSWLRKMSIIPLSRTGSLSCS